jgi:hypothetical protein
MKPMPTSSMHASDLFRREVDIDAERLENVGAARLRRDRAAAMLGDARAGSGGDEHRRRRDVEGLRAVAAGAAGIDQVRAVADLHLGRQLAHHLRRRRDFADGFLLDAQAGDDRRDHHRRHFAAHDLAHQRNHFVVKDLAVFDDPRQGVLGFHWAVLLEEVLQQIVAALGQDRFRVELHPFDGQGPVAQAHDLAVVGPGGDFQAGRQGLALDGQRMVARAGQRTGQPAKDALVRVLHRRHLAVHQLLRVHDAAAESLADRLMAEADAEQGNPAGKLANRRQRDAGLRRRAGPGEMTSKAGFRRAISAIADGIVAEDPDFLPQLAKILHEVVGKGVVVVDHQQHAASLSSLTEQAAPAMAVASLPPEVDRRLAFSEGLPDGTGKARIIARATSSSACRMIANRRRR